MSDQTKVLFIYPPVRLGLPSRYPPMGYLYMAAVLEKAGVSVEILDLNERRLSFEEVKKEIRSKSFDVVGIGGMTTIYYYLKLVSLYLKEQYPDIPIIGGGSVCTSTPETVLKHTGVDVIVAGEGESVITDLVHRLKSKASLSEIRGIYYKDENNHIHQTEPRKRIKDISVLPPPAYHLVDMEPYLENNGAKYANSPELDKIIKTRGLDPVKAKRPFPFYSKRGCPFSCNFCYRNFGRKVSYLNIDNTIEQIKAIEQTYNTCHIVFGDELWNVNKKASIAFCNRVVKDNLKFVFSASNGLRADLIDRELLLAMKEAGFYRIGVGVESFHNPSLKAMGKKQDAETIYNALKLVREVGLVSGGAMMLFGYETDSRESMDLNVEKLSELGYVNVPFNIPCPYPGSYLYTKAVEKGLITDEEDWLMQLADRDISDNMINMSNMSDKELLNIIHYGQDKLMLNHLKKYNSPYALPFSIIQPLFRKLGVNAMQTLRDIKSGRFFQNDSGQLKGDEYIREEALELLAQYEKEC